jgi:ABC-type uncharacterized transport system permease subunit
MIRTMGISGALFGTIGFFIVCGVHQSFSSTIVGGQGFTGVLVAWLGHFDPLEIMLFAFLSFSVQPVPFGSGTACSLLFGKKNNTKIMCDQ